MNKECEKHKKKLIKKLKKILINPPNGCAIMESAFHTYIPSEHRRKFDVNLYSYLSKPDVYMVSIKFVCNITPDENEMITKSSDRKNDLIDLYYCTQSKILEYEKEYKGNVKILEAAEKTIGGLTIHDIFKGVRAMEKFGVNGVNCKQLQSAYIKTDIPFPCHNCVCFMPST